MTITDQLQILDRKIMQNEAQCDLDRKAAKIFALFSNNLKKYEYLTGKDLGLKPSTIEQTKFEYSSLGKIFNKALNEDDKKQAIFKRLKNIENAQKRVTSGNDNSDDESIHYTSKSKFDDKDKMDSNSLNTFDCLKSLRQEVKDVMDEIKEANDDINDGKLLFIVATKKGLILTLLISH